jgi:hypothetical protein
LPACLSDFCPAPPPSPTSTTTVPSHTACPPALGRLTPRYAASMGSDSHTREPKGCEHTHSRTRPPPVPAAQGVEGLHTTSKSCGSHLQIESPPPPSLGPSSTPKGHPSERRGWVGGWMALVYSKLVSPGLSPRLAVNTKSVVSYRGRCSLSAVNQSADTAVVRGGFARLLSSPRQVSRCDPVVAMLLHVIRWGGFKTGRQ